MNRTERKMNPSRASLSLPYNEKLQTRVYFATDPTDTLQMWSLHREERRKNVFDAPVPMFSTVPQREMVLPIFIMTSIYGLKPKDEFFQSAPFH